jgi:hypothetical protein
MSNKNISLLLCSIGFMACCFLESACQKKETVYATPPDPQPSVAATAAPAPPSDDDAKSAELQKTENELKSEQGKLTEEENKTAQAFQVLAETEGPRAALIASLRGGASMPVLIVAYGTSIGKLRSLENEIVTAATKSTAHFTRMSDSNNPLIYGEFFVQIDSLEKLQILLDYSRHLGPDAKMVVLPAQNIILRHYVQFEFKDPTPFSTKPIMKRKWVGDSSPAHIDKLPAAYKDLETLAPYASACEWFDLQCLKTLMARGYFANTTGEETAQTSLDFFQSNLREAVKESEQHGVSSLKGYFSNTVQNVSLITEVWVMYPDTSDLLELSSLQNIATRAERYQQNGAIFQTPISFRSAVQRLTNNDALNFSVTSRQFYEYVCKVTTCLDHSK